MHQTDSLPQITFFFRHINDLNFSMPLIMSASNPRIFLYEDINTNDRRMELLKQEKVIIEKIHNPLINQIFNISDIFSAILRKIGATTLANFSARCLNHFGSTLLIKNFLKILKKDNFYISNIFAFDHVDSKKSKMLIQTIRDEAPYGQVPKIISLPHGADLHTGQMYYTHDYEPPSKTDFSHFDFVICNDAQHFDRMIGAKTILESLFYTEYWFEFMNRSLIVDSSASNNDQKNIEVLFLLSKFSGNLNVHLSEIIRCIRIIGNFKNITLKIKPHPRGGLQEIQKVASKFDSVLIVEGDVQENIIRSDCVINIDSSAVLDAFLANKPIIYPSFVSSNDFIKSVKDQLNIANSPDEFYRFILSLSRGDSLRLPKYKFIDWEDGIENWSNFFSSL